MPIVPAGSINLSSQGIPDVTVQIQPPQQQLNGVATDVIAVVGTATYGPVNSPVTVGTPQDEVSSFGRPENAKYDLGTQVATANLQNAANFICVRVTDGTDVASSLALLDTQVTTPAVGAILTSKYTGTTGNEINAAISIGTSYTAAVPTYKLTIFRSGYIAEIFDNIGGTGNVFWQNLVSAVNNGQSTLRGPSQLVIASLGDGIGGVTVTVAGSYTTIPTLGATIGSGAVLSPRMKAVTVTAVAAGGTGYAVNDTVTLAGGTNTTPAVLTVTAVSGGVITSASITTPGSYSALPTNPVAQATTSGGGSGATFTMAWGLLSVVVQDSGEGYTSSSALTVSTGAATGTLSIGSPYAPAQQSYVADGGTNGNDGVTDETLIGDDSTTPRTGMYALRGSLASMIILADQDDPTYWTDQVSYSLSEGLPYMIGTVAPGYQENIAGATLLLQNAGIDTPYFKLPTGDWVLFNDTYNNLTRYASPQGFIAGELATLAPSNSSLNKIMRGIVGTQKTSDVRVYSNAELEQLKSGRLEVITKPIPASQSAFGCRLGVNTSSNALTNQDNYPRMIYFLGQTILKGMGVYIGLPQTPDVQQEAKDTLNTFLNNIWQQGMIGYASDPNQVPFSVVLDGTNNPPDQVALGIMQANVTVVILSIIQELVVNLDANQNSTINVSNPIQI